MTSSQGTVPIGTARANRWRVTDDVVDTTRPPIELRPLSVAARPKRVIIDLARSAFVAIDRLRVLLPALCGAAVPTSGSTGATAPTGSTRALP